MIAIVLFRVEHMSHIECARWSLSWLNARAVTTRQSTQRSHVAAVEETNAISPGLLKCPENDRQRRADAEASC